MAVYGPESLVSTGVAGLDAIIGGGLPRGRVYLLEGSPGTGKTTLALQFLLAAANAGARTLYVTLSETAEELRHVAGSHGWDLDGIPLFELSQAEAVIGSQREQTILHPWEVELVQTVKLITDRVEAIEPAVVVFDSLSEMRLLAQDPLRYRRQLLTLKQYFAQRGTTVLFIDDMTAGHGGPDSTLHSLSHGVITLERVRLDYGGVRRRIEVQKIRGVAYRGGLHDIALGTGGITVFPSLVATGLHRPFVGDAVASGSAELDTLLGGGPLRGTSMLVLGPAGSGKTNLCLQYVHAACMRGERCVIYEFDERVGTLLKRARSLGLVRDECLDDGRLRVHQLEPTDVSPGEMADMVRREVEENGARVIVLDSLAGYVSAMPQERQLMLQLHELLSYLNQQGVLTLLVNPQQSLVGTMATGGLNVSFIADTVLLLRFFESFGRVRKALSVIKHRGSTHEETIRELRIDARGIRVGEVLDRFRGVLSGVPVYLGEESPLLEPRLAESGLEQG